MTRDKIDKIFESYGQYATGKDYALVNAVAEAVLSQRTWVGLTDEDDIDWEEGGNLKDLVKAIEAKLKEKNT